MSSRATRLAKHFPGLDYLSEVVRAALASVNTGGRILLTDVRDFTLEGEFHSAVVCANAHKQTPTDVLMARVNKRRMQQRELMIDPRWFSMEFSGDDKVIEVRPGEGAIGTRRRYSIMT